jgi:fibronectin type 3 domain-containing protein
MKRLLLVALIFAAVLFSQTTHSVTLTWPPNSTGDPVTTYNVLKGTTSGGESTTPVGSVAASACTTTCTYIDNAVVGGATYYYEITATNSAGTSSPSPEVTVTVPFFVPATPQKPTATAH